MYAVDVQNEVETLKQELAAANLEIAGLKMRLKNAELMYQFASAELVSLKKPAPANDPAQPNLNSGRYLGLQTVAH